MQRYKNYNYMVLLAMTMIMFGQSVYAAKDKKKYNPGLYITVAENIQPTKDQSVNSEDIGDIIKPGRILNIKKVVEIKQEKRIRGQLENDLWVSIINTENGDKWLEPHQVKYPQERSSIRAIENFKDQYGRNIVKDDEFIVMLVVPLDGYMKVEKKNGDIFYINQDKLDNIKRIESKYRVGDRIEVLTPFSTNEVKNNVLLEVGYILVVKDVLSNKNNILVDCDGRFETKWIEISDLSKTQLVSKNIKKYIDEHPTENIDAIINHFCDTGIKEDEIRTKKYIDEHPTENVDAIINHFRDTGIKEDEIRIWFTEIKYKYGYILRVTKSFQTSCCQPVWVKKGTYLYAAGKKTINELLRIKNGLWERNKYIAEKDMVNMEFVEPLLGNKSMRRSYVSYSKGDYLRVKISFDTKTVDETKTEIRLDKDSILKVNFVNSDTNEGDTVGVVTEYGQPFFLDDNIKVEKFEFKVGDNVMVKNNVVDEWQFGKVFQKEPLEIKIDNESREWKFVKPYVNCN